MEGVMATCTATGGRVLLRAALLVTTGLVLSIGSPAWARVGVTSGADGDPLGKPPNENERILRIGIDVQANELITTNANDRAHLVFIDGSSLTVGPNARLTIDRFVFDPSTQKGELAINASKGVLRLVGGKISKTNAITITTPSSTIGIRGGITILSVTEVQTIAGFVFGHSMTVTAGGQTTTAWRAGSAVTTKAGGVPGALTLFKHDGPIAAALSQLEGASSNNNNSADQSAQKSGFSNKNSGQPAIAPNFNQNGPPNTNNNTLTNAVSFSNPAGQPVGNSTPQNQKTLTTTTLTTTTPTTITPTTITPTTITPTTTTPTTTTPTTNSNNPPPSGPSTSTQTGFTAGWVVIDQPRSEDDRHSRRVSLLSQPGTVSITTNTANPQAIGTLKVGVNDPHNPASATLQLSGTSNGTSVVMHNDPLRPSTLQVGDRTYQISPTSTLVGASSSCTCEFLSFGAWTSRVADPRPNNGNTYVASGAYVAGMPSVQLPTTNGATYNGVMAGVTNSHGQINPATGTYQNIWDFAARSGQLNITFANRSYSGRAAQATTGPGFTGTFGRTGSLNGSFFASPSDGAAYQAGTFSIGSARSRYQATGIFAGQR
jgi:FecR protein